MTGRTNNGPTSRKLACCCVADAARLPNAQAAGQGHVRQGGAGPRAEEQEPLRHQDPQEGSHHSEGEHSFFHCSKVSLSACRHDLSYVIMSYGMDLMYTRWGSQGVAAYDRRFPVEIRLFLASPRLAS